eukprot:ANDGO_01450.mRNA.1 hypothetical protein
MEILACPRDTVDVDVYSRVFSPSQFSKTRALFNMNKNIQRWYDEYIGNFSIASSVLKVTHHAVQRARERGIPIEELSRRNSFINAHTFRVIKHRPNGTAIVITAFPRNRPRSSNDYHRRMVAAQAWSAHARHFRILKQEIPRLIGNQGETIKEIQRRYHTHNVDIMFADGILHVDPGVQNFEWHNLHQELRQRRIHVSLVDAP